MDEISEGLRYLFQTKNPITFCISGSGNAGIEGSLVNLIEEGDVVLVAIIGTFGKRAADIARRMRADVRVIEAELGTVLTYEQIRAHLEAHRPKVFFTCHGDSSTGALQPVAALGELCRRYNCLLVVDAVATLGAVELLVDEWEIDVAFSGSQKTLGAPAGLAPITFNSRAWEKVVNRKTPVQSYYYDARLLASWWGCFGESIVDRA